MGKQIKKIQKNAKRFFTALESIKKTFQEAINEQPDDVKDKMNEEIKILDEMNAENKVKLKNQIRNKRKTDNQKKNK